MVITKELLVIKRVQLNLGWDRLKVVPGFLLLVIAPVHPQRMVMEILIEEDQKTLELTLAAIWGDQDLKDLI